MHTQRLTLFCASTDDAARTRLWKKRDIEEDEKRNSMIVVVNDKKEIRRKHKFEDKIRIKIR
jgi:hypothetical protein